MCVLFSILPAGIMYALNFGRLGLPQRQRSALYFVLGTSAIYYLIAVRALFLSDVEETTQVSLRAWFQIVNIVVAWRFYIGQQALFARHVRQGGRRAPLLVPFALSALFIVAVALGAETYVMKRDEQSFYTAVALFKAGKYRDAESIFKSYKRKYPEETSVSWNLALIYANTGRDDQAKQELKELLNIDPNHKDARRFLGELEAEKANNTTR